MEDPEAGVLGDDGDDLSCVGGADAEALAGDHDDAVSGDAAFGLGRPSWWRGWQGAGRLTRAGEREAFVEGDGVGPGLDERVVGDGVDQVAVQAQRDALADQAGADRELLIVEPDYAVTADDTVDLDRGVLRQPDATVAGAGQSWSGRRRSRGSSTLHE